MSGIYQSALIVGASRGLGLGLVQELIDRGWNVIATERKNDPASALRKYASNNNNKLKIVQLDINDQKMLEVVRKDLSETSLNLLFINAGVIDDVSKNIGEVSTEEFNRVMITNALSPMRAIEKFDDLVTKNGSIGVMSSGLGSVGDNSYGSYEVYRASKASLNTLMRSYASRKGERSLFAISPGWVKTDMGGPEATLDVKTSASGIVDTLKAYEGKPGMRFVDYQNQTVNW